MSIVSDAAGIALQATRRLHGEAVTLYDSAGVISVEIPDAIATIDNAGVGGLGDGPADRRGVLRLAATHRAAALASLTASVRGQTWHVLAVGEVFGDSFRVELGGDEEVKTNLFDLSGQQAVWHEP